MEAAFILQILQWLATGALKLKEADGTDAQWVPVFVGALTENRPLTQTEMDSILAVVDASVQAALAS
jgi:hypothetical protein